MSSTHVPTPLSTTLSPTQYRIVGALVTMDVSYEDRRPVLAYPIVLTSEGLRVRHFDGSPAHHDDFEGEQFGLWSEEKSLGVISLTALLAVHGWRLGVPEITAMDDQYVTSDLYIAGLLVARGHSVTVMDVSPSRCRFIFPAQAEIDAAEYFRDATVSARQYANSLKDLKALMYSRRESR